MPTLQSQKASKIAPVYGTVNTVEPRLTNTLLRRTPHLNERFWSVPDIFPVKSCLKTSPWANNLALPVERTAVCPPNVSVSEVFSWSDLSSYPKKQQHIRDTKSWNMKRGNANLAASYRAFTLHWGSLHISPCVNKTADLQYTHTDRSEPLMPLSRHKSWKQKQASWHC